MTRQYTIPLAPHKPSMSATCQSAGHGALRIAATNSAAPKCATVGVVNAATPQLISPMRRPDVSVMTTNVSPVSAPAEEPTIT